MDRLSTPTLRHDLAASAIAVKIHWFGLILGYLYVNCASDSPESLTLNAILTLGLCYNLADTIAGRRGRVFLAGFPLGISLLEAVFIGLLCYFDSGAQSPFRYYYLLSLICCAIRHSNTITYLTCAFDCISYGALYLSVVHPRDSGFAFFLMVAILIWVTWAASSLSQLLKEIGGHLGQLNMALRENQAQLETRIEERTRELRESQAQLMHQDKMAGFGLLAAGIAHEVGNPLTSISSLIQMMEKRDCDDYTRDKLSLVGGQLTRIQGILRELINFSRPASQEKTRFAPQEIVHEALRIAKYYQGTKLRTIHERIPTNLGLIAGVRAQLVQVIFNLVLNAIDATSKGGVIELRATPHEGRIRLDVEDNGSGIPLEMQRNIFQPYFTTKRQGTGLGLFVSRKLIEEHGGSLTFESRVGRGTLFRIELPVEPIGPRPASVADVAQSDGNESRKPIAEEKLVPTPNELPPAKEVQRAES